MCVQCYPVARVGPSQVYLHVTDEFFVGFLLEGRWHDEMHVITGRRDFIRQSVLTHFRVVDIVKVDTALRSFILRRKQVGL